METILNKESRAAIELMVADGIIAKDTAERYFPELKESENERIKKIIKNTLQSYNRGVVVGSLNAVDYADCIAWLERQCEQNLANSAKTCKDEQKPANKIQIGKIYKCIASPRYSTFVRGELYMPEDEFLCSLMNFCSNCFEPIEDDEQKPYGQRQECVDCQMNYAGECKGSCAMKRSEQKPAFEMITPEESLGIDSDTYNKIVDECIYGDDDKNPAWSEEDERILNTVIHDLRYPGVNYYKKPIEEKVNWLKSLKERVLPQPKQEWSEEDEKMLNDILMCGERHCYLDAGNIAWLKSLRPQNTWKPSDEQMADLWNMLCGCRPADHQLLQDIYYGLKNLREE